MNPDRWNPATEAPRTSGWYPVICEDRGGWLQAFYDRATKNWTLKGVTHWARLPKLPNGK